MAVLYQCYSSPLRTRPGAMKTFSIETVLDDDYLKICKIFIEDTGMNGPSILNWIVEE